MSRLYPAMSAARMAASRRFTEEVSSIPMLPFPRVMGGARGLTRCERTHARPAFSHTPPAWVDQIRGGGAALSATSHAFVSRGVHRDGPDVRVARESGGPAPSGDGQRSRDGCTIPRVTHGDPERIGPNAP